MINFMHALPCPVCPGAVSVNVVIGLYEVFLNTRMDAKCSKCQFTATYDSNNFHGKANTAANVGGEKRDPSMVKHFKRQIEDNTAVGIHNIGIGPLNSGPSHECSTPLAPQEPTLYVPTIKESSATHYDLHTRSDNSYEHEPASQHFFETIEDAMQEACRIYRTSSSHKFTVIAYEENKSDKHVRGVYELTRNLKVNYYTTTEYFKKYHPNTPDLNPEYPDEPKFAANDVAKEYWHHRAANERNAKNHHKLISDLGIIDRIREQAASKFVERGPINIMPANGIHYSLFAYDASNTHQVALGMLLDTVDLGFIEEKVAILKGKNAITNYIMNRVPAVVHLVATEFKDGQMHQVTRTTLQIAQMEELTSKSYQEYREQKAPLDAPRYRDEAIQPT